MQECHCWLDPNTISEINRFAPAGIRVDNWPESEVCCVGDLFWVHFRSVVVRAQMICRQSKVECKLGQGMVGFCRTMFLGIVRHAFQRKCEVVFLHGFGMV